MPKEEIKNADGSAVRPGESKTSVGGKDKFIESHKIAEGQVKFIPDVKLNDGEEVLSVDELLDAVIDDIGHKADKEEFKKTCELYDISTLICMPGMNRTVKELMAMTSIIKSADFIIRGKHVIFGNY